MAAVADPDSGTLTVPVGLLFTASDAVLAPTAPKGLKVTLTVQLEPFGRVRPQVVAVIAK
jgi:hypothetical protein